LSLNRSGHGDRYPMTEDQKRVYASEKQDNFRWVAKCFATFSEHEIGESDLVSDRVSREVAEYGAFP
jgi:hypothetical protein